jgi:hypothetical protein
MRINDSYTMTRPWPSWCPCYNHYYLPTSFYCRSDGVPYVASLPSPCATGATRAGRDTVIGLVNRNISTLLIRTYIVLAGNLDDCERSLIVLENSLQVCTAVAETGVIVCPVHLMFVGGNTKNDRQYDKTAFWRSKRAHKGI